MCGFAKVSRLRSNESRNYYENCQQLFTGISALHERLGKGGKVVNGIRVSS